MNVVTIERLPVLVRAGYDCRADNANCPGCNWLRERNRPTGDHGISGGVVLYAVRADVDGVAHVLSLEVLAHDYPESARSGIDQSRKEWAEDPVLSSSPTHRDWFDAPRGAGFYLHTKLDEFVQRDEPFAHNHEACDFFDGKPCRGETLTWVGADDFYRAHGYKGPATVEQLKTLQTEEFWIALGEKFVAYTGGR